MRSVHQGKAGALAWVLAAAVGLLAVRCVSDTVQSQRDEHGCHMADAAARIERAERLYLDGAPSADLCDGRHGEKHAGQAGGSA